MVPRTIALARASGASRTPSRRRSSPRSVSYSSRCSSGAGVWFSNGIIATVFTWAGNPPPAKPYGKHAPRTIRRLPAPNRRIKALDLLGARDGEQQRAVRARLFIPYSVVTPLLHPFGDAAVLQALESHQPGAGEGSAPNRIASNVCANRVAVNADCRVGLGRSGEPAQGRPEHRHGRQQATYRAASRRRELVAGEDRRAAAQAAVEEKIHPRAVRRSNAGDPLAARAELALTVRPAEV